MISKRTTGRPAFFGLISGTTAAAVHHGLTLPAGAVPGIKGAGSLRVHDPSETAQNFWTAIWAWCACFVITILVKLRHATTCGNGSSRVSVSRPHKTLG